MNKTILILAANPKDTPQLRLDQEVREIENGLERAQKRDEFIIKQRWAARPEDVRRAMLDFNPNIVHFCGHGAGEEGIAFEDEMGHTKLVNADVLAGFFNDYDSITSSLPDFFYTFGFLLTLFIAYGIIAKRFWHDRLSKTDIGKRLS